MAVIRVASWLVLVVTLMQSCVSAFVSSNPSGFATRGVSPVKDMSSPVASSNTALFNGMWSGEDDLQGADRLKACIPYLLPILDADQFGHYIHMRIPPLGAVNDVVLGPLLNIYHSVPFLSIILFVLLALGTRSSNMARGVRFNAQQAVLIDVALIFPELIRESLQDQGIPRYIAETGNNFVYYTFLAMLAYSFWSNLNGKKPNQIPIISSAAEYAVGPF